MFSSNATQVSTAANYIEDVFRTWLYTGNSGTQTITNGIDLATKGGLVWTKNRGISSNHNLIDTVRGISAGVIRSNLTNAQTGAPDDITAFNSNGYSLGYITGNLNDSPQNYASWTFAKQPKFFDVVTYTGTGANRTIAHNLGAVPGCIIVKRTDTTGAWQVYHRSLANTQYMVLNTTAAVATGATRWNSTTPTDTVFSVGTDATVNASGGTYVAYIFAHDSGGFGLTGSDNVISCGSYVGNGSTTGPVVTLGYEPQWVLVKRITDGIEDWELYDNMRGIVPAGADRILYPNQSIAEQSATRIQISATGFSPDGTAGSVNASGKTYIYIAIRRGPMKVPTTGTSVFSPIAATASTNTDRTTNFPIDLQILCQRDKANYTDTWAVDRLRGVSTTTTASGRYLITNSTNAEQTANAITLNFGSTGFQDPFIFDTLPMVWWNFRRAPGFFDEVCWTGDGTTNQRISHNLGAVPELIITKGRSLGSVWYTYSSSLTSPQYSYLQLSTTSAQATNGDMLWGTSVPTSTDFGLNSTGGGTGLSGVTMVGYLFASCPGVSKVGSYTGNGTTQTINCGFAGGARFVLIKRTDSTGDWYVWDSARGIIPANDPYLLLNSTAAEVTSTDYVDTTSVGFEITSTAPAAINANGGTFIFLAIA